MSCTFWLYTLLTKCTTCHGCTVSSAFCVHSVYSTQKVFLYHERCLTYFGNKTWMSAEGMQVYFDSTQLTIISRQNWTAAGTCQAHRWRTQKRGQVKPRPISMIILIIWSLDLGVQGHTQVGYPLTHLPPWVCPWTIECMTMNWYRIITGMLHTQTYSVCSLTSILAT